METAKTLDDMYLSSAIVSKISTNDDDFYLKLNPIHNYNDLCEIKSLHEYVKNIIDKNVSSIDEEWMSAIKDKWWMNKPDGIHSKYLFDIRSILLEFGGDAVCLPAADFSINELLVYGQLWLGNTALKFPGNPSDCHVNCISIANVCPNYRICTGYALSADGMWREHSWLIDITAKYNRLLETTEPRILYYGFAMSEEYEKEFADKVLHGWK